MTMKLHVPLSLSIRGTLVFLAVAGLSTLHASCGDEIVEDTRVAQERDEQERREAEEQVERERQLAREQEEREQQRREDEERAAEEEERQAEARGEIVCGWVSGSGSGGGNVVQRRCFAWEELARALAQTGDIVLVERDGQRFAHSSTRIVLLSRGIRLELFNERTQEHVCLRSDQAQRLNIGGELVSFPQLQVTSSTETSICRSIDGGGSRRWTYVPVGVLFLSPQSGLQSGDPLRVKMWHYPANLPQRNSIEEGAEACSNNLDDNASGRIDCEEPSCAQWCP